MTPTTTVRISKEISNEIAQIAALMGRTSGELLAEAWKEFLTTHKETFAQDMEEAAKIVRTGTTQDLASFISRNVEARATAAAEAARSPKD
jgi:predicted transcriptional regulator